jgi:hypothetical protein
LYLSGLALAITTVALVSTPSFRLLPDLGISLAIIGLVAGIAFTVPARLERAWVPIVMIPFGILATVASFSYSVTAPAVQFGQCGFQSIGRGFPLAWNFSYSMFGLRCPVRLSSLLAPIGGGPLYSLLSPRVSLASFALDVAFFVGAGVAIIQLYRGITGRTITAQSLLASKMT